MSNVLIRNAGNGRPKQCRERADGVGDIGLTFKIIRGGQLEDVRNKLDALGSCCPTIRECKEVLAVLSILKGVSVIMLGTASNQRPIEINGQKEGSLCQC